MREIKKLSMKILVMCICRAKGHKTFKRHPHIKMIQTFKQPQLRKFLVRAKVYYKIQNQIFSW